jgi:acyl-CoA thioesterase
MAIDGNPAATRPFYRLIGIEPDGSPLRGDARLALSSRADLENSRGEIHGGALASLLDATMGSAVRAKLAPDKGATTVTLTVNYLKPARGRVNAEGRVLRVGKAIASVEAHAVDESGDIVAHGVGVMRILDKRS